MGLADAPDEVWATGEVCAVVGVGVAVGALLADAVAEAAGDVVEAVAEGVGADLLGHGAPCAMAVSSCDSTTANDTADVAISASTATKASRNKRLFCENIYSPE